MTAGIYKIQAQQGKMYIGSSVDIESRWRQHVLDMVANRHTNIKLQRAYNKYGVDYFTFTIIEVVADKTKLLLQEQKYLNILFHYNISKYNILRTAGSNYGVQRSQQTKEKMSKAQIGNKNNIGRVNSMETRQKMSIAQKGRFISQEHRDKLADTNSKTVYTLLSPNGEVTEIINLAKFGRDNDLGTTKLYEVVSGKRKSHKGWRKL